MPSIGFLDFEQFAIILVLLVLIFSGRNRLRNSAERHQLWRELRAHLPAFSAETTRHTEAEFIRDRLPARFPLALFAIAALVVVAALAWWLGR